MNDDITKAMEVLLGPDKKELSPLDVILKAGEGDKLDIKTFRKSVTEVGKATPSKEQDFQYKQYMDKSKGISREDMPQIHEDNLDDFLIHFASKVPVKKLTRKLCDIKPTQGEINEKKILKKIKKKSTNWKERKYIVSLDGYLLDGHHDWAQGLEMNPEQEVEIYRIGVPIDKLLDRTKRMKITTQRDLSDNEIKKSEQTLIKSIETGNLQVARWILQNKQAFTSQVVRTAIQKIRAQV